MLKELLPAAAIKSSSKVILALLADTSVTEIAPVVELTSNVDMKTLQQQFVERGIWVRPFGKLVYVMPPYVITDDELHYLLAQMSEVVKNMQGVNANVLA